MRRTALAGLMLLCMNKQLHQTLHSRSATSIAHGLDCEHSTCSHLQRSQTVPAMAIGRTELPGLDDAQARFPCSQCPACKRHCPSSPVQIFVHHYKSLVSDAPVAGSVGLARSGRNPP
jgi:hypothetical protein